jgi:hypothetical protein
MKKILFPVLIFGILLTMSNCNNEDNEEQEDPSTYTLIGTWETEGEYVVNGDERTYNSTLTFTEANYKELYEGKSKQGIFHLTTTNTGDYVADEEKITGTCSYSQDYHNGNPPATGGPFPLYYNGKEGIPYKFIDKNSLEFRSPSLISNNYASGNIIYKRK